MNITILSLILLALAVLIGIGFFVGAVLAFKNHKVLGVILAVVGLLVILCPIALYALVVISARSM
jgi:hypothetical protein